MRIFIGLRNTFLFLFHQFTFIAVICPRVKWLLDKCPKLNKHDQIDYFPDYIYFIFDTFLIWGTLLTFTDYKHILLFIYQFICFLIRANNQSTGITWSYFGPVRELSLKSSTALIIWRKGILSSLRQGISVFWNKFLKISILQTCFIFL